MVFRILTFLLLPVICLAQINTNGEKPRGELLSNEISPTEMKRNASFNLDELKVRWKKAALENCPGVPCVTTTVPGAPSGVIATLGNASASVAFTVPNDGGSSITGYTVTSIPSASVVTGAFSPIVVTGLMNGTVYTFTVVATNSVGSSSASSASNAATPSACGIISTVQDVDLNSYTTVAIGTQCWTKQNLKVSRYNDMTAIALDATGGSLGDPGSSWSITTGAYCIYGNEASSGGNATNYGFLYNWYAAAGIITIGGSSTKNICPLGWRVPIDSDWTNLTDHIGLDPGTQLKSNSSLWNVGTPPSPGNDQSGFSALPGGSRDADGSFDDIRDRAVFWSATSINYAWYRYLVYGIGSVEKNNFAFKSVGASVRCLKD